MSISHQRVTVLGGPPFELDENGGKAPAGPAGRIKP